MRERYDDGAFSGASLERPALQVLLEQVRSGKIAHAGLRATAVTQVLTSTTLCGFLMRRAASSGQSFRSP